MWFSCSDGKRKKLLILASFPLNVGFSNWESVESEGVLSICCDRNNYVLPPGKIVPVTLIFTVGADAVAFKDFELTLVFSGSQ